MKTFDIVQLYRKVKDDYEFKEDVMCPEDERVYVLKEILAKKLSPAEKNLIILYAEIQSYRELGKKMGLSHMTIRRIVMKVREKILNEYKKAGL